MTTKRRPVFSMHRSGLSSSVHGPSRRMWLQAAGASLALPWLPSALGRDARAAAPAAAAPRVLYWFVPNGLVASALRPATVGPDYELSYAMEPVAPLQHRISPLTNFINTSGLIGTHAECFLSILSDVRTDTSRVGTPAAGQTIDQWIAARVGPSTPFPSLQLATDEPDLAPDVSLETYYTSIAWASPTTPLSNIRSPRVAFDRMFPGHDSQLTDAERQKRLELRTSVLDVVLDRINHMSKRLSSTDLDKLDQYATGVRELESRISQLEGIQCEAPSVPGLNPTFLENVEAMADLMVVALQCDLTRVITWMLGNTTSETVYSHLGITDTHHNLSHDFVSSDTALEELLEIQHWQIAQWVALAQRLAAITESDGEDLLSHTLLTLVTEFSNSSTHDPASVMYLIAGGESHGIKQGVHREFDVPHANFMRATASFMGLSADDWSVNATGVADLTT